MYAICIHVSRGDYMFFFFNCQSFAVRLRDLRNSKGITMLQLADAIGTTKATISNFENAQRNPSLEMLIKLADYFNVSIDFLVGRTNDPTFHKKTDY